MTTTKLTAPPATLARLTPAAIHSAEVLAHRGFALSMISDGDAFMSRLGDGRAYFAMVEPTGEVNGEPLRDFLHYFRPAA